MWFIAAALLAASVPLPVDTPIPCLVCAPPANSEQTFAGTVQSSQPGRILIFNGKSHQTMGFLVPADFHAVQSSDGKIKDAPVTTASPGLLARVTYRSVEGDNQATLVLLLTINQCRALEAAEKLSRTRTYCPD